MKGTRDAAVHCVYKWLIAGWLAVQAHFAASYLVPLDEQAQRTFGGLLCWLWPWAIGDAGPLGRVAASGSPTPSVLLAITAATVLAMAALAVLGWWVPHPWWRALAVIGSALCAVLCLLYLGWTKLVTHRKRDRDRRARRVEHASHVDPRTLAAAISKWRTTDHG